LSGNDRHGQALAAVAKHGLAGTGPRISHLTQAAESQTVSCTPVWLAVITQVLPDIRNDDLDERNVAQARIHLIDVAAGEVRETLNSPRASAHFG